MTHELKEEEVETVIFIPAISTFTRVGVRKLAERRRWVRGDKGRMKMREVV